jgi:hypothetical protein
MTGGDKTSRYNFDGCGDDARIAAMLDLLKLSLREDADVDV